MLQRIATALISIPVILGLLYMGGTYTQLLVIVLVFIGLFEFGQLAPKPVFWDVLWLFGLSYPLLVFTRPLDDSGIYWGLAMMLYYLTRGTFAKRPAILANSHHLLGVIYVSCLYTFIWLVRDTFGFPWMMFAVIVTWVSDTGAYFIGSRFGRHKLAPIISPNKSIEGALGGLAASVVVGAAYSGLGFIAMHWVPAAVLGLGLSAAGQMGDLAESAVKREQAVKDSGSLLPGHGGILDRFDSLAFAVPVLYIFLHLYFRQ